ncbi:MAG: hypothetical protein K2H52_17225 [Lachnospiraceae bacterium]|nr:hypothetical protein [Lachnospiraceae bacterium]MDE6185029.1 hypothetical protein [Lachnospiraceae bacterium]
MKNICLFWALILTASLTACASRFDGSRTGNENQLIMEYEILNMTDTQNLELKDGDIVHFDVTSKSGSVAISLQKGEDKPIYEESDIPTSTFQVAIKDSGTYTVSVTGHKAKGSVSITKESTAKENSSSKTDEQADSKDIEISDEE